MSEQITDLPQEEVQKIDKAMRNMIMIFAQEAHLSPDLTVALLANAVGRLVHILAEPDQKERSLATIFKIIRIQAQSESADVVLLPN